MLNPLVGHIQCVELRETTIEARVSVDYLEIVHRDYLDLVGRRDIRETAGGFWN